MSAFKQESSTELIEFLLSLVKNSPYGVLTINLEGEITMANTLSAMHLGFAIDQVIETPVFDVIEQFPELSEHIRRCLSGGRKNYAFDRCEYNNRYYSIKANIILSGMLITTEDVTEKIESEATLKHMNAVLMNNNRQLEQYTYIVSHNLRAPVANISGLADILAANELDPETSAEILESLRNSANTLNEVLGDLNRILSIKSHLAEAKQSVSIGALLRSVTGSVSRDISVLKAEIRAELPEEFEIYTVKSYLHSILLNLVTNAIKYRNNANRLMIDIRAVRKDGKYCISVSDNGLGIDMEKNRDKVFGLYKRFHGHVSEGRGIGLYLVKTQVEALGGTIDIESIPLQGTKFIIHL